MTGVQTCALPICALGEPEDAIAIVVIVILNAVIGFVQEYRAERALETLRKLAAHHARVLRGGTVLTLTFLLPFVGWIGLTIWTLVSGFAALVFAVRETQRAAPVPPAASAPPNVQVVA